MLSKIKELGFTEEDAIKLEKLFKSEIDGNYVTKDRFNQVNDSNKLLKESISARDKQLDDLKKSAGDNESLKAEIESLKTANKEAAQKYEADLKASKIKSAVRNKLGNDAFDVDLVESLMDLSKIELDDKDNIKAGFEDQYKSLRKDKAFLFKPTNENKDTFKFEGARGFESNKDANAGSEKSGGLGAQLAAMKLGTGTENSKAMDYYFGNQNKQ